MSGRRIEVYHSTGDGAAYCWRDLRECGDGDVCADVHDGGMWAPAPEVEQ